MNIGSNNTFSKVEVVLITQYPVVGPFKELYTSLPRRHVHYNTKPDFSRNHSVTLQLLHTKKGTYYNCPHVIVKLAWQKELDKAADKCVKL